LRELIGGPEDLGDGALDGGRLIGEGRRTDDAVAGAGCEVGELAGELLEDLLTRIRRGLT
jgi:hypothetical protein